MDSSNCGDGATKEMSMFKLMPNAHLGLISAADNEDGKKREGEKKQDLCRFFHSHTHTS